MHPRLDVPAACLAALLCLTAVPVLAQEPACSQAPDPKPEGRLHALSLMGEPKFKPGFEHFDWVNPDAPKGGTLRAFAEGSFDSLNAFSVKGRPRRRPRPHLRFADDRQPR
ncbi:MAG: hypothetical protein WDN31_07255 [Hyphomicrobium sp.]